MLSRFLTVCTLAVLTSTTFPAERTPGWDKDFYTLQIGQGVPPPPTLDLRSVQGAVAALDSGDFLVAGRFTNIQNAAVANLALWNGTEWQPPLPDGKGLITLQPQLNFILGGIRAMATRGAEIFLAGDGIAAAGGTPVNNLAWWNGAEWSDMAGGTTGQVSVLVVDGPRVYAGGQFEMIGSLQTTNIAVWDGTQWSALGDGLPFAPVALAIHNGDLYASTTESQALHRLLRWTGADWEPLANAFAQRDTGLPLALLSRPEGLYVAGQFTEVGGVLSTNAALWNGSNWQSLDGGIHFGELLGYINSLAEWNNQVLAAGYIPGTNNFDRLDPALWDGAKWTLLTNCPVQITSHLAVSGDRILVHGKVNTGTYETGSGATYFDGSAWKPLGQGFLRNSLDFQFPRRVVNLDADPDGVLLAGKFGLGNPPGRVIRWNGEIWETLSPGLSVPRDIIALAKQGDLVWAGTDNLWPPLNTSLAPNDGTNWVALNSRLPGRLNSAAVVGSKVYAGGDFGLAVWNGWQFASVDHPFAGQVFGLAADGHSLSVAVLEGFPPRRTIYQFDGQGWTVLASGLSNSQVFSLQMLDSELYALGGFTNIAGKAINSVARWDGVEWQPVAPFTGDVMALADDGRGTLYLAGLTRGVPEVNNLHLFRIVNGQSLPMAQTTTGHWDVQAAQWWRGALYIAGLFRDVDSNNSVHFAAWHDPDARVEAMVAAPTNIVSGNVGEVRLTVANLRPTNLAAVRITLPLPQGVTVEEMPANASLQGTNLLWELPEVAPGVTRLAVPLRFVAAQETDVEFRATVAGDSIPAFKSEPLWTTVWDGNIPPLIAVPFVNTSPSVPLLITVEASDPDGTVARVDFYDGATPVGSDAEPPFEFLWSNPPTGVRHIRAAAIDNQGKRTFSVRSGVQVTVPPGGYFQKILLNAEGQWLIEFTGVADAPYQVEKSPDLKQWEPELTITNSPSATTQFTLPLSSEAPSRFWRLRQLP